MATCGNDLLHEIWQEHHLAPLSTRSSETEAKIKGPSLGLESVQNCDRLLAIVDAIKSHDQELAASVMQERVRTITEKLRKFFGMYRTRDGSSEGLCNL